MWPEKPKIFTIWLFTEKICQLLTWNTAWHIAKWSRSIYEIHSHDCSFLLPQLTLFRMSSHPVVTLFSKNCPLLLEMELRNSFLCHVPLCRQGYNWVDPWTANWGLANHFLSQRLEFRLRNWGCLFYPVDMAWPRAHPSEREEWSRRDKSSEPRRKKLETNAEPWEHESYACLTYANSTIHAW